MVFKDFPGQSTPVEQLSQMIQADRLPHALIFAGPEACGKLGVALTLAQSILCKNPDQDLNPCGVCNQCIKTKKLEHPDLHFSFPYAGSSYRSDDFVAQWKEAVLNNPYLSYNQWTEILKIENKQTKIYTTECNNIIKKLSFKTYEGSKKIMIIWMAEFLGIEGNRLLKLIEEPPAGTQFILIVEQTEKVLNTILSRCQLIKFNKISDIALEQHLQERFSIPADRAQEIAFFSEGNMNKAISSLEQPNKGEFDLFIDWLRKAYQGKPIDLVQVAEDWAKMGKDQIKQMFNYGLQFIAEINRLSVLGASHSRLNGPALDAAEKLKQILNLHIIEELQQLIDKSAYQLERNANVKLLLLNMGIQMNAIIRQR